MMVTTMITAVGAVDMMMTVMTTMMMTMTMTTTAAGTRVTRPQLVQSHRHKTDYSVAAHGRK